MHLPVIGGLAPVESAESSRQMPVANRVVPAQADNCRYAYHEAALLYIRDTLFQDRFAHITRVRDAPL
jgi:hypothetical protein